MKRTTTLLAAVLSLCTICAGVENQVAKDANKAKETVNDAPDWVSNVGMSTNFPASKYFTGYGVSAADSSFTEQRKIVQATEIACADLVSTLRISVSSENRLDLSSKTVKGSEQIAEDFRSSAVTKSDLTVEGIQFQRYVVGKAHPAYVLAYLDRATAKKHYATKLHARLRLLRETIVADSAALAVRKALRDVEETMQVEEILNGHSSATDEDFELLIEAAAKAATQPAETAPAATSRPKGKFPADMIWDNPDQARQLSLDDLNHKQQTYHFRVVGAAPYPDNAGFSPSQRRLMAARTAKVLAMRDLMETVGKVRVDSKTKVSLTDDGYSLKDECATAIRGHLQGATFSAPKYLEDEVQVVAEIQIGPEFPSAVRSAIQH
jgi:hypothetical protein